VAKPRGTQRAKVPPILQTKHKHMFNLHEIGQFGQFKIIKIVATRPHFLKLKCTNSISAEDPPQTPLEELTALPQAP